MKKMLSLEELESQTALELPERDLMALLTIVIGRVDIIDDITITIRNNNVELLNNLAVSICAAVLSNANFDSCDATVTD